VLYSGRDNCWKIVDFGICCEATSSKLNTSRLSRGTACYRAPEIIREQSVYNNKVDIWALGCIFYEILSGVQLFSSDWATREYAASRKLELPVPWPAWYLYQLKNGSETVHKQLLSLLSIKPSDRPSAREVRQEFLSLASSIPDEPIFSPVGLPSKPLQLISEPRRRSITSPFRYKALLSLSVIELLHRARRLCGGQYTQDSG
jgi:serine/threonine protein kinase